MINFKPLLSKIRMDLSRLDIVDIYEYEKDGLFKKAIKIRYRQSGAKHFMFLYWDGEAYSQESYLTKIKHMEKPSIPLLYYENFNDLCKSKQIFIVEGEKDVRNLYQLGLVAVTLKSGSDRIAPEQLGELSVLKDKEICLLGDYDETGYKYLNSLAQTLYFNQITKSIKLGDIHEFWPEVPEKGDISDWLEVNQDKDKAVNKEVIENYFKDVCDYQSQACSFKVKTVKQLLEMDFPEREWLIEGMLKDLGLTQLGGDSKLGKSLFAQQLSAAIVREDGTFLGRDVKHGNVVYVDFENSDTIQQQRFKNFLVKDDPYNERLKIVSVNRGQEIPRLDNTFIEQLDAILKELNYEVVLVVIDTWTHIRSEARGDVNLHDREETMKLLRYCDEVHIPFLLLTHTLKNTVGINKFNTFIGSTGIQGSMDTQMLITESREENSSGLKECVLSIRGREVEEQEFVIYQKDGYWNLKGNLKDVIERREAKKLLEDPITEALASLMRIDSSFEGTTSEFIQRCRELGIPLGKTQKSITMFIRKNARIVCPLIHCRYTELNHYKASSHQTFCFRLEKKTSEIEDHSYLKVVKN